MKRNVYLNSSYNRPRNMRNASPLKFLIVMRMRGDMHLLLIQLREGISCRRISMDLELARIIRSISIT